MPKSLSICLCQVQGLSFPGGSVAKNPPANAANERDTGSIPGSWRSLGEGHGNPLQYSCLENPMDRGACQATVHGVTKNWTLLKQLTTHAWGVSWNVGFLDLILGKSQQNWDRLVTLGPQMSWEGTIVDLKSIWIIFVHLVIFFLTLPRSKHFECEVEQIHFAIPYMIYIGGFDRKTLCNKHTHTHTHTQSESYCAMHGSGPQPFAEYCHRSLINIWYTVEPSLTEYRIGSHQEISRLEKFGETGDISSRYPAEQETPRLHNLNIAGYHHLWWPNRFFNRQSGLPPNGKC